MDKRKWILDNLNLTNFTKDSYDMYVDFGSGYLLSNLFEGMNYKDLNPSVKAFYDLDGKIKESDLFSFALPNYDVVKASIIRMRNNQEFLEANSDDERIEKLATNGRKILRTYEKAFLIYEKVVLGSLSLDDVPSWLKNAREKNLELEREQIARKTAIHFCELYEEGKLTLETLREGVEVGDEVIVPYHGGHYLATLINVVDNKAIVQLPSGRVLHLEDMTILSRELFSPFNLDRCGAYENNTVYDYEYLVLCELKHNSPLGEDITLEYNYNEKKVKLVKYPAQRGFMGATDNYHKYYVYEDEMENLAREKKNEVKPVNSF